MQRNHVWALVAIALCWACSSNQESQGEWTELTGSVGGHGGSPNASSSSMGGGSVSSSSAGGSGGIAGGGGAGGAGGGGGMPCVDNGPGEPNNGTESTALPLGNITDCDNTGSSVSGVLTDATDIDWYRYTATDDFGCTVDPTRTFSGGARLCKFAQCTGGGAATVVCYNQSSPATSPSGRPGCCRTSGFSIDVDCPTVDDDATIYIRVDQPAMACTSYSIQYHF